MQADGNIAGAVMYLGLFILFLICDYNQDYDIGGFSNV